MSASDSNWVEDIRQEVMNRVNRGHYEPVLDSDGTPRLVRTAKGRDAGAPIPESEKHH